VAEQRRLVGTCPLCGRRVPLGKGRRILAHRVTLKGLWGVTVLDGPCAGRGHVGLDVAEAEPDPIQPIQLPAVLQR